MEPVPFKEEPSPLHLLDLWTEEGHKFLLNTVQIGSSLILCLSQCLCGRSRIETSPFQGHSSPFHFWSISRKSSPLHVRSQGEKPHSLSKEWKKAAPHAHTGKSRGMSPALFLRRETPAHSFCGRSDSPGLLPEKERRELLMWKGSRVSRPLCSCQSGGKSFFWVLFCIWNEWMKVLPTLSMARVHALPHFSLRNPVQAESSPVYPQRN